MVTLIDTPAATNANAYVDDVAATTYLQDNRLHTTAWDSATEDDRKSALIWATFILDSSMEWYGTPWTTEQALRFPRTGIADADDRWLDYQTIPVILERATAELAFYLLTKDRTLRPAVLGQGLQQAKVGPIAVTLTKADVQELIPDYILTLLTPLGSLSSKFAQGDGAIRLWRA